MWITKTSILTGKTRRQWIAGLTQEMVDSWRSGQLIQEAMPAVAPEWREFLISGITPAEWEVYTRRLERMESNWEEEGEE